MPEIRDKDGKVIQRSRNLDGIRRYVGRNLIKVLAIDKLKFASPAKLENGWLYADDAKLSILFDNGCSYETNFASFKVLKQFVRQWRNVYGAPLRVNGEDAGVVSYHNPKLS